MIGAVMARGPSCAQCGWLTGGGSASIVRTLLSGRAGDGWSQIRYGGGYKGADKRFAMADVF
jgi:hypothetical protein